MGVVYKFNAPWAPSDKTRIVYSEECILSQVYMQCLHT